MFLRSLWLTAVAAATLFMVACDDSTTQPDPAPIAPNAPTAIMATSKSATAISVKWTASATGEAADGYILTIADDGGANPQEITITGASTTSIDITGLTEGNVYQMFVRASNDTANSTASATIKWAPAQRHIANLRLYETSSSMGSGIELPNSAGLTLAEGGRWDVCLDTRNESFDIGSPALSSYTFPSGQQARVTLVGKIWQNVASLDDIYEAYALNDAQNGAIEEKLLNFNSANTKGEPFAFVVKTAMGNYAKVLVKANAGVLLQGTAPDRYVDLEISYQSGANIPYAVKVGPATQPYVRNAGNVVETNIQKKD